MAVESVTSPFKRDELVQTFWQGQDLTDFPVMTVSSDSIDLYRAHGVAKGAWWYAQYPPEEVLVEDSICRRGRLRHMLCREQSLHCA